MSMKSSAGSCYVERERKDRQERRSDCQVRITVPSLTSSGKSSDSQCLVVINCEIGRCIVPTPGSLQGSNLSTCKKAREEYLT